MVYVLTVNTRLLHRFVSSETSGATTIRIKNGRQYMEALRAAVRLECK